VTTRRAKPPPPPRGNGTAPRLLAAIAEDLTDDHARQVYADLLMERGDPRGTFIAMQLGAPRDERAELALLKKHATRWLGPLAGLVGRELGIGRDYFDRRTRFERGFVTCCTIDSTAPRLRALATEPVLATLEHVGLPRNTPHRQFLESLEVFLDNAALPALRSLEVSGNTVALVLASAHAKRLEALRITGSSSAALAQAAAATLPDLRTLWFRLEGGVVADEVTFEAAKQALSRPSLERLEVEVYQAHASYRRTAGRWTVTVSNIRGVQMAGRLEQLVR
jgi:uncharacterized protein (TIGR02996 family)